MVDYLTHYYTQGTPPFRSLSALTDKPPEYYQPDYHGQVFTRWEILAIIAVRGLPEEGWEPRLPDQLAPYIEAQVWNREPLLTFQEQM